MPGLERRLKAELSGDVQFDRFSRGRYATDASHYQITPVGVVAPRTIEEAERAIGIARAEGVSVLARGGGTSQAGQTVGSSLVVDCSKYLTRILDLDIKGARCAVEPGLVLDDLNRQLKPHGLWFPVDISTASRATIGGMAGNNSCGGRSLRYGTMRDNVLAIEAVLADGTLAHFGRIGGSLNDVPAPLRPLAKDLLAIGAREADEVAARFPKVQRRVGGYNLDALGARKERHQSRPRAGRLRRHARLFHAHRIETVAAARPPRGRRLPFRQLPRSDECRPAHRAPAADRGRTDRPHHDRAGARDPDLPADAGEIRARGAGRHLAGRIRRSRSRGKPAPAAQAQAHDRRSRFFLGQERRSMGRHDRGAQSRTAGGHHRAAHLRPQHHDVDEGAGQTGLLRRGLRGAARASRRLHQPAHRDLRQARHARHLVRACRLRLSACAPGAQSAAGEGRACHARDRRGGLRHGARIQRLAFRRARRWSGAVGIQRADVRFAAGARLRGGEGPLRPARALQSRQGGAAAQVRRSQPVPLSARLSRRRHQDPSRLVGLYRRRQRVPGRDRDVQQQRRLPQTRRRRHVPELSRHPRRTRRHARPRQYAAARRHRPARARRARQ